MYDELIKRLRSEAVYLPEKFSKNAELLDVLMKAADAIEELTKPRWIPVSERLPKEDGCYLVVVKNDHQRRYSKTAWFSHDSWFARQDVTHWMPLPVPPKED